MDAHAVHELLALAAEVADACFPAGTLSPCGTPDRLYNAECLGRETGVVTYANDLHGYRLRAAGVWVVKTAKPR